MYKERSKYQEIDDVLPCRSRCMYKEPSPLFICNQQTLNSEGERNRCIFFKNRKHFTIYILNCFILYFLLTFDI